ncbi:MAG: hypothetical protein MK080_09195, partial [Opitutales bacterium]|nr:hypothetical protein [Opitutales bacterium]
CPKNQPTKVSVSQPNPCFIRGKRVSSSRPLAAFAQDAKKLFPRPFCALRGTIIYRSDRSVA